LGLSQTGLTFLSDNSRGVTGYPIIGSRRDGIGNKAGRLS
jgi:hypothetical protein